MFKEHDGRATIVFKSEGALDTEIQSTLYTIVRRRLGDTVEYTVSKKGGAMLVYNNGVLVLTKGKLSAQDIGRLSKVHDLGHLVVLEDTYKTMALIGFDTTTKQTT